MGSGRAKVFAVSAVVMLLLAATVAFAASSSSHKPSSSPAARASAAPRALRYACASNLYNARKVLHYVARASECKGSGETLVTFSKDFPVYTCRKEHGGFAARQRRFQFPTGIRSHGPAGLMRLVDDPSKCAPASQPNETPIELPRTTPRIFCAAKQGGELRWVNSASSCDHKEFPVRLAARSVGTTGNPIANDDSASTDEGHSIQVNVLANDRNTASSSSHAGLHVVSTDTTGTKGDVTVNPNDTITYDPAGKFESLKAGETATDTFKYRARKGTHTSAPGTVTVTITGVNDAPVAKDDSASTDSGHSKSIAVLSNDTDVDGDSLSVASVDTAGTQGTVTVNGDGTVTYNPNHQFDSLAPGATAHDSFKYKANDGHVDSNVATVDVTVTGVDDPPVVTTTSGSTAYTESAPAVVVDGGVTVSDPDSASFESAQVRVSSDTFQSGDVLDFTSPGPGGINGFYDGGTGVLSLTGHASKADWQAALRLVKFRSDNDNPASPKMIVFTANDGTSDSAPATKQVTVANVNDAPTVTTSGGQANFTEGSAPAQVDAGITVEDPDSLQLHGAVVSITSNFSSADGDTLSFTNQNGISGSYNSTTGVLTLTGDAPVSDYQAAVASITFSNTSDNPSTAVRTVSFQVDDGNAINHASNTATRDVGVTRTNDAPVVTTTGGSTSVAEDAQATIDSGLTVTDPDDTNLESAQVRVSSGFQSGDDLIFVNTANISGVYNSGTGVLTLSGTDTVANYQAAFRSIKFKTTNNNPTTSKTIEFKANDGDADSNLATKGMSVSNVNDPPTVQTQGAIANYTEGSAPTQVDPALNVNDPDDTNLESAVVSITVNFSSADGDSLNFTNTPNITGSYNSGTGVLTLSGTDTVANYQAALRSITYSNTSDNPSTATRTVSFKVNDGDADSNTATRDVGVTATNDAPVVTTTGGNTAVAEDAQATIDSGLTVTDPDDTNLESARVRVSSGFQSGDDLIFVNTANISGVYNSGTGVLTLSGTDTVANYQSAFRSIKFETTNNNPSTSKTIEFKANDGDADSNLATKGMSVSNVNDPPVLTTSGGSASYTEDSTPAQVDPALTVSDPDSANLNGGAASISNNFTGGDTLNFTNQNGISGAYNTGTGQLLLSGTASVADYQAALRSITFSTSSNNPGSATRTVIFQVSDTNGALSGAPGRDVSVTPHNDAPTADDQSTSTSEDTAKGITLTGSDPEGSAITFASDQPAHGSVSPSTGSSVTYTPDADYCGPDSFTFHTNDGSVDSANGTVSITVNCVNDAPVVDLNGSGSGGIDNSASFTEDAGAVTLAPAADVSDVDSANLASAEVKLTNIPDTTAESLSVNVSGTSITAAAYNSSTGVLALSGSDTKAHYQQVLRSVAYNNSSQNPDTANRIVNFKANDGSLDSTVAKTTLSVTRANDAPTANNQSGLTTNEDTALGIVLTGGDVDGDPITFAADQPAHGSVSPVNASSVTYTPDPNYCGPDSFTFHTNDGTVDSANGTIAIDVTCVNDAPTLDLDNTTAGNGSQASFHEPVLQPGAPVQVAPNAAVADVDDANLESGTITLINRPDGNAESIAVNTSGTSITASSYDSSTGLITLTGSDTKAHYQQVIRSTTYQNSAAPPNATTRSIEFKVNDGDVDSATQTATVSVVPLNAPPVMDLNGTGTPGLDTTASFTEDSGPATLAPNADVTDADNANLSSATVTLTNRPNGGAESLSANVTGTSITADAYVPGTGVLFLHGVDTKANYQQVIRTVAYNNTSNTPTTTNRSITFKVNDGQDDSNVATADTTVTATNDPPTATDQSVSTNEDTAKMITLSGTDPENDSLSFTYDSTSAQGGTITGTAPDVTYTPATDYCGPDSFNFVADDGNGGTDQGTISITVDCANDAPVLDLNGAGVGIDNNAAFTENQPGVQLAPSATASDVDSPNLTSATVVLVNHPDGNAEGLTATPGGSITVDAYDTSTGTLFLHGSDTPAHYQQVLRSVVYNNTSDTPDSSARQIHWKVTDDGSLDSATATTTLTVTPVNDPPALDLNGAGAGVNETASYTEDQPATTLAPSTVASDPDNANLQSATVTLTNHPDNAAESLSVDTSGTSISAVAYNSGTGVLSLSGSDTVAAYQQVLRTVKYLNTSQNADATNRVVNFVVNDGSSNSNSPTVSVTITVINDPPVVDMNGGGGGIDSSAAFTEDSSPTVVGSGPVNLGASATVSDVDNATLNSATLTVTNHPDGVSESLSVNLAGTPITTGGYNASTGVLQLTGNGATTAQFQSVIRSAQYNNVSNTPDATDRDITTKVNDGAADSTVAHTTVTVTPTNDAPVAGDETFNSTNSAIGNTTLNVNDTNNHGGTADGRPPTPDPTDTSPVTDRPHKEITGDIIANDTDPDNTNSTLTVTAGTFATNDGGTVTIQSDGDFNFEPAPSTSCTDTSDFFDYTVTDGGSPAGTDTGRVTVAITGCVWYVNNNDAQGNSGTSEKPFDTTAQAQTASGNNQTTFVYDGDDTTTGYNTGYTMNSGETLLSEGARLPDPTQPSPATDPPLHSADAANKASITNNNADVVTLAGGATVKSFNIDPQGTGGGIFGTGLGATTVTLDDLNVVDNGTKGTQPGLELDTNTGTTTNVSNLTVNNGDGSSATTTDEGVKLNATGTVNFAPTGTISIATNGAKGLDATAGAGTTSLGSASTFDDITVTNSGNGGVLLSGTTGSGTAFGDGSGTDLSLTTVSGAPAAFSAQTAGSFSVPSAGQSDVHATGGPAVDVVSSSGSTMPFDDVDSTNSANDGINIDSIGTGTFSATSGDIGGEAGIGFDLNGGSGAITYGTFNNCTFSNGSGPLVAEVTGRTGGVVSIPCNMNDTNDAGGGLNVANNTGGSTFLSGATKQFNTGASDAVDFTNSDGHTLALAGGGLAINTTSGNGINATTSGTFQVSGSGNTLDSTALSASNRGLNVVDTDFAAADATFDHINTNGGADGIRLNNTGASGNLAVTGVGGTCTLANTTGCSGGTIQNATGSDDSGTSPVGTGIALKSTRDTSLTRMHITNSSNYAIRGDSVPGGFSLSNSVIDGVSGTEAPASAGSPFNESAIRFTELTGSSNSIANSGIQGGVTDNLGVINSAGSLNRLTVQSSTFGNNSDTQGNRSIDIVGTGTATTNVTVDSSTFTASASHDFGFDNTGSAGDVVFTNNTMSQSRPTTGPTAPATGAGNVKVTSGASSAVTLNVASNNMTGATGNALLFVHDVGGGSLTGTVNNNSIGTAATANSGSLEGDGIQLNETGGTAGSSTSLAITNNLVRQYNNFGIELASGSSGVASETGNISATVTGNTVSNPGTNASIGSIFQGIQLNTGTTPGQSFSWCANIKGNSIIGSGRNGGTDFRLRQRQSTTVRLPGYGGTAFDTAAVTSFMQNQNDANPNSAGAEAPTPTGASLTDVAGGGFVGGAACASG